MALFDFMNRGQAAQQPSTQEGKDPQKVETAKEMSTREAPAEKVPARPAEPRISDADKAAAREAGQRIGAIHQQLPQNTLPNPMGTEGSATPAAMRQNQTGQEKTQAALSPTDGRAGQTRPDETNPVPDKPSPRPTPTVARRPPSWER